VTKLFKSSNAISALTVTAKTTRSCDTICEVAPPPSPPLPSAPRDPGAQPCVGRECVMADPEGDI
jgi:hypothetical protein